jgi:hypothetical protein
MKNALIIEEQLNYRKQKLQGQKLVLENISPIWASRLKKENFPTFMSWTWMKWRFELQNASKCVVGEAYGYSCSKLRMTVVNVIELVANFCVLYVKLAGKVGIK